MKTPAVARQEENPATAPGRARMILRQETAQQHAAVDLAFSVFDLGERAGYLGFLRTQFACIEPIESALTDAGAALLLPDWAERCRAGLLRADLRDLGDIAVAQSRSVALDLSSPSAVLGAIYVMEGSRFGGAVLAKRLLPRFPSRFLNAPGSPAAWRALVAVLDARLTDQHEMARAVGAARSVFAAFASAADHRPEHALA